MSLPPRRDNDVGRAASDGSVACSSCRRTFVPRFGFHTEHHAGQTLYYCSQTCRQPALTGQMTITCGHCLQRFLPRLAAHSIEVQGRQRLICDACFAHASAASLLPQVPEATVASPPPAACASGKTQATGLPQRGVTHQFKAPAAPRAAAVGPQPEAGVPPTPRDRGFGDVWASDGDGAGGPAGLDVPAPAGVRIRVPATSWPAAAAAAPAEAAPRAAAAHCRTLAVINQKGGTAKTTTAVSLAAGLAHLGHRTLLIDLDPQGNVAASLGLRPQHSAYHLLSRRLSVARCRVNARPNLDVITADESLATAELELARSTQADRLDRLGQVLGARDGYAYVILDCAPALSLINHNALVAAGEVLVPVSCDYLALVGVRQVLRTLRRVTDKTGRPVRLAGVLPTFYDVRNRLSLESLTYLRKTFGSRALPPVRVSVKLAEAPSHQKTIFEYAPESHGARDYLRVVHWLQTRDDGAAGLQRPAEWSVAEAAVPLPSPQPSQTRAP